MAAQQFTFMTKVILAVVSTLMATAIIALIAYVIDNAGWRGGVDRVLLEQEHHSRDLSTALTVLADHGTEFAHLRGEISTLRGELLATRTELIGIVTERSHDRFTGTDWEREKQTIDLRFERMEDRSERIEGKLDEIAQALKDLKK